MREESATGWSDVCDSYFRDAWRLQVCYIDARKHIRFPEIFDVVCNGRRLVVLYRYDEELSGAGVWIVLDGAENLTA
jgi:hypothetical protein